MTIPSGKGIFIWNLGDCGHGSDMGALVNTLVSAGIQHVTVKVLNGTYETWGSFSPNNKNLLPVFIPLAKAAGIQLGGYQYIYGGSSSQAGAEGVKARAYAAPAGLDFFVIDAESEYKMPGSSAWASAYMNSLAGIGVPVGLCSYRYPLTHPEFPWSTFLSGGGIDFHMPQVYWAGATSVGAPAAQLNTSYMQLMQLKALPFVPVGAAYCEWGWCATGAQVDNFSDQAQVLGLPGISFWDMKNAFPRPDLWNSIKALDWGAVVPPPVIPPPVAVTLPQLKVLTSPALNVRSAPVVSNPSSANVIGTLAAGTIIDVLDLKIENADRVWAKHGANPDKWSAVTYGVNQHMGDAP